MSFKKKIKTTAQELAYRDKCFHDIRAVKDRQIICTSCGIALNIKFGQIFSHPLMEIPQCEVCWKQINTISSIDKNTIKKYCYICGNNIRLYECSNKECNCAFCKKCIRRNASLSLLDAENEDWKCFICKPKPFWKLRAVCAALIDAMSNDSDSHISSDKTIRHSKIKSNKIEELKGTEIMIDISDNESDENSSTSKISNSSKKPLKHTTQQMKKSKNTNSYCNTISSTNKIRKGESTNETSEIIDTENEDIEYKKYNKKIRFASRTKLLHRNKEQKLNKSDETLNKRFSQNIEKDDSDSSSKEFQKEKFLCKKYPFSVRQLKDLNMDYTVSKSLMKNSVNKRNNGKKDSNKMANLNLDHIKHILNEYKNECLNFLKSIEIIEKRYDCKKDVEGKILMESMNRINKFKTVFDNKFKDLTSLYCSWESYNNKKNLVKESSKEVSNKFTNLENDEEEKEVSECDSEQIFSADEMKLSPTKRNTIYTSSETEDSSDHNDANTDDENDKLMDGSKNNNKKNSTDARHNLVVSPILGVSKEKKIEIERSNNKELILESASSIKNNDFKDDQDNLSDADIDNEEIETKNSSLRQINDKMLQNKELNNIVINESADIFDTSFNVEENCDKTESPSKIKSLDNKIVVIKMHRITCNDNDKISSERATTSLLSHENEGKNLSKQKNVRKVASVTSVKKMDHDNNFKEIHLSEKTNMDDAEFLADEEILLKKALLESDSDNDISEKTPPDANVIKKTKQSITDDSPSKKNKAENDSDVDSKSSTIIISTTLEESNSINDTDAKNKNSDILNKSLRSNENVRTEKAAKKVLLKSDSDDSTSLSSSESNETAAKEIKLDISNTQAKKELLLTSSSSESFSFESVASETEDILKNGSTRSNCKRKLQFNDSKIPPMKKKRLKLEKNYYYMNDKKLKQICKVHIVQLDKKVLNRHWNELQKSRQYLEHKTLKSLIDLDKLEKKRQMNTKNSDSSISDNDNGLSKIVKKITKKGKQTIKKAEVSLMDHLKEVENDDSSIVQTNYNSDESIDQARNIDTTFISNEALILKANDVAKQSLLNSSDSNNDLEKEILSDSDSTTNNDNKSEKGEDSKKKMSEKKTSRKDEIRKEDSGKSNWRQNKILTMKFLDSDSDEDKNKWEKKQEKLMKEEEKNNSDSDEKRKNLKLKNKKKRCRILDSDSDSMQKETYCSLDSDSSSTSETKQNPNDSSETKKEKGKQKRKKGKQDGSNRSSDSDSIFEEKKSKQKRRKRIKPMASDSDSSDTQKTSQGTPGKSGRKNIRKVLKDKQVADDTKQAAKEEEERLKRIAERQALYNDMYEIRLAGEEKVEKLVLDFNTETKEELVSVNKELVKSLKPHQAQGIKFMWDACFESLERVNTTSGSGCIIAHCMGLGKTLQVITLTHTLLTHEATGVKTILVICPLSTVLNWINEYKLWLKDLDDDIELYEMTKLKKNFERKYQLERWQKTGGVLIIGYEMFRNLTGANKNIRKTMKETILNCLVDPGADVVICDEGHLLKNEDTALSKCIRKVKTLRRIVLTGTPLQNNLIEYHCMVQFVKPNLLGTKKEFLNRFVNPIMNGQFDDSTPHDVKIMKKRAHVLHKMLEGSVQRFDYSVLTPFLPPKQEYVIFVRLTDAQIKMYQYYLDNLSRYHVTGGSIFADFQALQRIWTHPFVLRLNAEKIEKALEKKMLSESEGSLVDFINDDTTDSESSSSVSSSDNDVQATDDDTKDTKTNKSDVKSKRRMRSNHDIEEEEPESPAKENIPEWWSQFVQPEHLHDMRESIKLLLLFEILRESEQIGDKVLVFSQSLYSLTLIEEFLRKIDDETQEDRSLDSLNNHKGSWSLGLDYFRMDGQTSPENRSAWCKIFNRPTNTRARLFLISTRAGGLGINLTAANRVIIFDASWNPSHDVQSIFRIYRFGQKKPCYVYRFLAAGTMEEKIYNRQVTKLSLSCRVVDEQQIERHYSNHNLNELYTLEPYKEDKPTLNLPKDRLLAEIFHKYKDVVENYHEHDSLLENKAEEELNEEERKQAWLEYEEEKKGKPPMMLIPNYQNNLIQQCNMMINAGLEQSGISQNMSLEFEYQNLEHLIRKDFPNATLEQQKIMTNRAFMEMYNYWERQAVLQPPRNQVTMPNIIAKNRQMGLQAPQVATNSNIYNISQLGQLLNQNQSLLKANYVNANQPASSGRNLVSNPFVHHNVLTNNAKKTDDNAVEVIPTTSNAGSSNTHVTQVVQSTTNQSMNSKNQEE